MDHLRSAQEIYAAFGRGDVAAILQRLAPDVEREYGATANAAPWLQPRRGRDGAAAFFAALAGIDIHRFALKSLLAAGPTVVALVDIEFTVIATARRVVEEDEIHLWHFGADGLVQRFRHRVDTHAHHLACVP
jgi:ketosteroid isomerase-like protein